MNKHRHAAWRRAIKVYINADGIHCNKMVRNSSTGKLQVIVPQKLLIVAADGKDCEGYTAFEKRPKRLHSLNLLIKLSGRSTSSFIEWHSQVTFKVTKRAQLSRWFEALAFHHSQQMINGMFKRLVVRLQDCEVAMLELQDDVASFPRLMPALAQAWSEEIPVVPANPSFNANDDDQAHIVHLWRPARTQKLCVNKVIFIQTRGIDRASSSQHAANRLTKKLAVFKSIASVEVINF